MDKDNPLDLPRRARRELGPTGEQPDALLDPSDTGGIRLAVGHKDGKVIVDFGGQLTWFGMGVPEAEQLVEVLNKHIEAIKRGE